MLFFLCGMFFKILYILFLFAGVCTHTSSLRPDDCLAGEGRWEDPSQSAPSQEAGKQPVKNHPPNHPPTPGQRFLGSLIGFYGKYISPVDGKNCPCYPTCSQYSLDAIRKHGVLIGLVMTADRLMHENDEIRIAPLIKVNHSRQVYDPVESNDFWWHDPAEVRKRK